MSEIEDEEVWVEPEAGDRVVIGGVDFIITRVSTQQKSTARITRGQIDLVPVAEAVRRRDNLNKLLAGEAAEQDDT